MLVVVPNIYCQPNQPRRIFHTPKTTSEYVAGAGRCSHCPSFQSYCEACRQELSPFKTLAETQEYERGVQARLRRQL